MVDLTVRPTPGGDQRIVADRGYCQGQVHRRDRVCGDGQPTPVDRPAADEMQRSEGDPTPVAETNDRNRCGRIDLLTKSRDVKRVLVGPVSLDADVPDGACDWISGPCPDDESHRRRLFHGQDG